MKLPISPPTNAPMYVGPVRTSSFTGVATVQADGDLAVAGHGHYTGRTNAYVGARGKYAFSGAAPPATPGKPAPLLAHITGTLRY